MRRTRASAPRIRVESTSMPRLMMDCLPSSSILEKGVILRGMSSDEPRLIELMNAYQRGDPDAFAELYGVLANEMRRYFARVQRDHGVVHDLVQETFLELHRSRRTYTPPLPVRPWVFGIARHVAARHRTAVRFT